MGATVESYLWKHILDRFWAWFSLVFCNCWKIEIELNGHAMGQNPSPWRLLSARNWILRLFWWLEYESTSDVMKLLMLKTGKVPMFQLNYLGACRLLMALMKLWQLFQKRCNLFWYNYVSRRILKIWYFSCLTLCVYLKVTAICTTWQARQMIPMFIVCCSKFWLSLPDAVTYRAWSAQF